MKEIEHFVTQKDKFIKQTSSKVKKALRETVELDTLSLKVLMRYQKFLGQKVDQRMKEKQPGSTTVTDDMNETASIQTDLITLKAGPGDVSIRQTSNINTKLSHYYDSDKQPSVYYLKPQTSSIYVFDLQHNEFVAESLKYQGRSPVGHPFKFSTVQLGHNDAIYMIGGCQQSPNSPDFTVLPFNRMIDANLFVTEKTPMKQPRCSVALGVVRDRWILAMGGLVARDKPCTLVTCYDTVTN